MAKAGDRFEMADGSVYEVIRNRSGGLVRARNRHRPAARFEDFIEHLSRLMPAKGIRKAGIGRLLRFNTDV